MYPKELLLSDNLRTAHRTSWQAIGEPGDFFTGAQRIELVRCARAACRMLCQQRKQALSPNAIAGVHDDDSALSAAMSTLFTAYALIRVDSPRPGLTNKFLRSLIADTMLRSSAWSPPRSLSTPCIRRWALPLAPLSRSLGRTARPIQCRRCRHRCLGTGCEAPADLADHGLPNVPNIVRSMGLVPSAVDLFFTTFSPHYAYRTSSCRYPKPKQNSSRHGFLPSMNASTEPPRIPCCSVRAASTTDQPYAVGQLDPCPDSSGRDLRRGLRELTDAAIHGDWERLTELRKAPRRNT